MKFQIGQLVATIGVVELQKDDQDYTCFVAESLNRHINGDCGDLCEEDKELNNEALNPETQGRLLSRYNHAKGDIYIITEWDRSVTTILLPEEF